MILSNPADTLTVVDSLKNSGEEGGGWILHHVMDSNYIDFDPFGKLYLPHLELFGIDISITKNVIFMWIVALILIFLLVCIKKI